MNQFRLSILTNHTIFIKTDDLFKFLKQIDFEPEIIDL